MAGLKGKPKAKAANAGSGNGQSYEVHNARVSLVTGLDNADHDALVLVTGPDIPRPKNIDDIVTEALLLDQGLQKEAGVIRCNRVAGDRLILSPTGPITPYDDVRSVFEAARAGVVRALAAGSQRPVIVLPQHSSWPRAPLVGLLGALETLYAPLQARELCPGAVTTPQALGVYCEGLKADPKALLREAVALEIGRGVSRDIGGADPERMTPQRIADYLQKTFSGGRVTVRVIDDKETLAKEYPLLVAVSRAADHVPQHRACVVFLEYTPDNYTRTAMLVGKGVTYDTGGCDIKAGGVMAGMSRDKCGAAAIAGFIKTCEILGPELKIIGSLGLVRNSVGSRAYVADEVLVSRRGDTVRVGNTDAEGRLVMADLLAEFHERARTEREPHIYTVATLTGHAHRTVGNGYTIVMDNHVARAEGHAERFRSAGDSIGDGVEVSVLRREDLATHRGRGAGDAIHQADNKPSTATPRGHQAPAAFLLLVSGLHEGNLQYSHLDIAASAGDLPGPPTAAPLCALAAHFGLVISC